MKSGEQIQMSVRIHPLYINFIKDYCYFENITYGQGVIIMTKEFNDKFLINLNKSEVKKFERTLKSKKIFKYSQKMSRREGTKHVTFSIDQETKTFICAYAYYKRISKSEAFQAIIADFEAYHSSEVEAKKNSDYWDEINKESLDEPAIINAPETTNEEKKEEKSMKITDKEIESVGELAKNLLRGCREYNAESVYCNLDMHNKMFMVSVRVVEYSDNCCECEDNEKDD